MTEEESRILTEEVTKLNPSPVVELYELDLRPVGDETILYFHNGSIGDRNQSVRFRGVQYEALPIMVQGFEVSASGEPPRPNLSIMNVGGFMSALVLSSNDLVGAVLVRRRTFAKYLDGDTDSYKPEFQPDIFVVEQRSSENRHTVDFELGTGYDLDGFRFPKRQVTGGYCQSRYRGEGCHFAGRVCVADINNERYAGGLNYTGAWNSTKVYVLGDSVEFTEGLVTTVQQCIRPSVGVQGVAENPTNSPSYWLVTQQWQGEWVDQAYNENDVVFRDVEIYGVSRIAPKSIVRMVAQAKQAIVAGTPAPPNSLYWELDSCARSQLACRYRYDGKLTNAELPFGGFPGTLQMPSGV